MKRLFELCILLSFVGCTKVAIDENVNLATSEEYYAVIEGGNTRTYVDEQIRMRWTAEDKITLFEKNTYNKTYMFTGKTGANAGGFTKVSTDDDYFFGYDVDANYAVYPHSTDIMLDETDLFFTLNMPAEQTYADNSFGLGVNTMVAVSDNNQLIFKNVGSYLRVRLYGDNTSVSSVTLSTKGDEIISGEAKVTPIKDGEPTCVMTGSGKSIRLACPTPVTISSNSDAPTDFWIVVPPVTLENGFTVTVENSNGNTQTFDVNQSFTFERNKYNNMLRELEISNVRTIHVATAGTLPSLISEDEKYNITSLKITGDLNGTDFKLIREMLGCGYNNTTTEGCLAYLDLSGANIVQGGDAYWNMNSNVLYYTSDNTLGCFMFGFIAGEKTIKLPNSITSIEESSFGYSSWWNSQSDGMVYFDEYLLGVKGIKPEGELNIKEGTTIIADKTFVECSELISVSLPNSIKYIGESAFSSCEELTDITIPNSIIAIGVGAFKGCDKLTNINIPSSITVIENHVFGYCNLTDIEIPNSVTSIGEQAFAGNEFTNVTIPNSVTNIGNQAFTLCHNLQSVSIGKDVAGIGSYAFANCEQLREVVCYATIPPELGTDIFGVPAGSNVVKPILYVPSGCKSAYENSDWSGCVEDIIEMN